MNKSHISEVWTYFTICDAENVNCKLCDKKYSRKGRTTSGMRNHLEAKHKNEYEELKNREHEKQGTAKINSLASSSRQCTKTDLKQMSLSDCVEKNKKWDNNNTKSLVLDNLIGEMIALEDLPFSFVECLGFVRLINHVCPLYNLKSRQYFTSFICEKLYGKVKDKILELIKSFEKLALTTDIWSDSCSGVSLISFTCHGITNNFERKMIVLKAEVFNDGRHTGENIAAKLETMLSSWGIPKENVICIVRDGGTNMKKGISLLSIKNIDCLSHQIQLVVKEGLKSQESIIAAINKCKKIATHFHHSNVAQDELVNLQEKLNQPKLRIIQESVTRWNSTFYMLERILKNKDSLCLYASTSNKISQLTSEEWILVEKLITLLQPFEEITRELSAANVSISSVIPLLATLEKVIDEYDASGECIRIRNTILVLKQEMRHRFSHLENDILFATATFIDLRYKMKFFKNPSTKDQVIKNILDSLGDEDLSLPSSSKPKRPKIRNQDNENLGSSTSLIEKSVILKETMKMMMDSSESGEELDNDIPNPLEVLIKKNINEYILDKRIENEEDPLLWWKVNSNKYGILSPVAREYLVTPPTSVPSERVFSGAGLLYTPHRNRLHGERASKLLFLKFNIPLLQFNY